MNEYHVFLTGTMERDEDIEEKIIHADGFSLKFGYLDFWNVVSESKTKEVDSIRLRYVYIFEPLKEVSK